MKNKSLFISTKLLVLLTVLFTACQKDPFEGIESKERAITSFTIDGQIGLAEITRTPNEGKMVIYVNPGTDLENVEPQIITSYQASVTPASGELIDLSDSTYSFVVSSASGDVREWTLEVEPYDFDLAGEWDVASIDFWWWIGEGEDWGWQETRPLVWNIPGTGNEEDNTLEFHLEGVDEEGLLFGTYTFDPGPDGEYADFIYTDDSDYNYKFRRLPAQETGTWHRNFETEVITFNKGEANEVRTMPLEWENGKSTLLLKFNPGPNDLNWDHDGNRQHLGAAKEFWYVLEK